MQVVLFNYAVPPAAASEEPVHKIVVECACGCTREIEVDPSLLEDIESKRFRPEFRPYRYCAEHDGFIVSGATGYIYAKLRCLNSINE